MVADPQASPESSPPHGGLFQRGYYSIAEAAALLGVSRMSVWRWIRAGRLPAVRLGPRTTRIARDDLERALAQIGPAASPAWVARQRDAARAVGSGRADQQVRSSDHTVQFYESVDFLVTAVADFIGPALAADEAALIIAAAPHRQAFEARLRADGLSVDTAQAAGRYVAVDAAEVLARFMVEGEPDPSRFAEVVGGLIAQVAAGERRVRIFGEMVALLVLGGEYAAARRLEELWNDLGQQHSFSLLCAYPIDSLAGEALADLLGDVCARHSRVIPAESFTAVDDPEDRLRAAVLLQQQAASLKTATAERERLEAAALRLAAIVESADDAIIGKTLDGIIVDWNRGAERLYGYAADEVIGRPISLLIPDDRPDELPRIMERLWRGERIDHFETERVAKDGRRLSVSVTISPVRDAAGRLSGASVIARDISERKRAERALAERTQLLALSAAVGQALVAAESLPEVLQRCAQALVDHLDAAFVRIWTLNKPARVLELQASAGLYTNLDGRYSRVPVGQLEIGRIARERRPYHTNTVGDDPQIPDREWAQHEGLIAFAGYPLLIDDELVGVVGMFLRQPLSDTALHALASLSDGIAIGIRRKQAETELREQSEVVATVNRIGQLLSAELDLHKLLQAVTDAATELTGAKFGAFFYNVLDEQGEAYTLYTLSGAPRQAFEQFPMPRATEIFGPTFRGEGIIRLDDVTLDPRYGRNAPYHGMPPGHLPVCSYLAAPVVSRSGEVFGGLFFGHPEPGVFAERSERLIAGIVGQAAIAIENARLFAQAQTAEARYRGLFEGAGDAILVWTGDGRYLESNPAATRLLGYAPEEFSRLRVQDLVAASQEWIDTESRRAAKQGEWRGELELRCKDGSTVPVEVGATPLRLPSGPVFVVAVRDISERRAAERMQQNFLATVSHELRNPLATVKGLAQLMQRRGAYNERALQGIVAQSDHLDRLVGDLLDVARLEAGRLELQREPLDLVSLVATNVEQAQARTEAHTIRLEAPVSPLIGCYDRDRLNQVFQNLLGNAIKYAPRGEILVRLTSSGSDVRVSVADECSGIAADEVPKLFQRFYRAVATADGATGFGIGLYVVRTLVEAHGGRIWVESRPGPGCEFVFTLPLDHAAACPDET